MPSSHLILCRPLLLLPPIPPSIRVFSNESTPRMRWPKDWSFSFSLIPSKEIPVSIIITNSCTSLPSTLYTSDFWLFCQRLSRSLSMETSPTVFPFFTVQFSCSAMSIELVMPSSHLILGRPLLLLPPIPPSIRVFSSESTLCMRWPKY